MDDNIDTTKEFGKTAALLFVALLVGTAAALLRPASISVPREHQGDTIFPDFTDATEVANLEILQYDRGKNSIDRLEIANEGGVWVIASGDDSRQGYPADANDAERRIREAAFKLMDLKVLDIASEQASDYKDFGVIEPDPDSVSAGEEGVGLLVVMKDAAGDPLAQLIIGKQVRGFAGQRFVRRPKQHRVYVANIDPENLSSRFEDWIEGDLLKINDNDIQQVVLKDYNFDRQLAVTQDGRMVAIPQYERRLEVTVGWNATDWKWTLKEFLQNQQGRLVPSQLMQNEELDTTKLDALKKALTELTIVDVRSKPAGLSTDLKAEKQLFDDVEAGRSLIERGFFPVEVAPQQVEILSSEGEVRVGTTDGVEYILRFGNTAGIEEREDRTDMMRFLLVTARVDEAAIEMPDLDPLPQRPTNGDTAPPPPDASIHGDDAASDDDPASQSVTDDSDDNDSGESDSGESDSNDSDLNDSDSNDSDDSEDNDSEDNGDEFEAELQRVQKENQRKLDEYNEKIRNAQKKVEELNERFADWYYVISEDVYEKIHLGRFDLIQVKADQESTGIDAFRSLETEGLQKDAGLN